MKPYRLAPISRDISARTDAMEVVMSEADELLSFMARKLLRRAEEVRTMVEGFHDPEARRTMLEVAERYEKLALRIENEGLGRRSQFPVTPETGLTVPELEPGALGDSAPPAPGALGLAQLGVPAELWQRAFALIGAIAVGATAWVRLALPNPPDAGACDDAGFRSPCPAAPTARDS
jgi:hypothetical protein